MEMPSQSIPWTYIHLHFRFIDKLIFHVGKKKEHREDFSTTLLKDKNFPSWIHTIHVEHFAKGKKMSGQEAEDSASLQKASEPNSSSL